MDTPKDIAATCLMHAVRKAARAVTAAYEAALAPSGLTAGQFSLLVALAAAGPMPHGTLARALGLDRTTLTRALAPLARRGLVETVPSGADGRLRVLALTAAGAETLALAIPLWRAAQDRAVAALGGEGDAAGRLRATLAGLPG